MQKKEIQVDRYSALSNEGVSIDFIDTTNRFLGWKTIFNKAGAWVQYNTVDFGKKPFKTFLINAISETGATLQIRTGSIAGPVIAEFKVPKSSEWKITKSTPQQLPRGVQNLFISMKDDKQVAVDWIRVE